MIQVTILSRHQCELCDVVLNMARRLQATTPFGLNHVNIDADAQLLARYGSRVPVLLIDQVEIGSGAITEADLRRAIKRARWRKPISRILSRLRVTQHPALGVRTFLPRLTARGRPPGLLQCACRVYRLHSRDSSELTGLMGSVRLPAPADYVRSPQAQSF